MRRGAVLSCEEEEEEEEAEEDEDEEEDEGAEKMILCFGVCACRCRCGQCGGLRGELSALADFGCALGRRRVRHAVLRVS